MSTLAKDGCALVLLWTCFAATAEVGCRQKKQPESPEPAPGPLPKDPPPDEGAGAAARAAATVEWVSSMLIWGGGIALAAGIAGSIVAAFWAPLKELQSLFAALAGGGLAALAVAPVVSWVGSHLWLLTLLVVVGGGFFGAAYLWAMEKQFMERALYIASFGRLKFDLDGDGLTGADELAQDDGGPS